MKTRIEIKWARTAPVDEVLDKLYGMLMTSIATHKQLDVWMEVARRFWEAPEFDRLVKIRNKVLEPLSERALANIAWVQTATTQEIDAEFEERFSGIEYEATSLMCSITCDRGNKDPALGATFEKILGDPSRMRSVNRPYLRRRA